MKKQKPKGRWLRWLLITVVVLAGACALYLGDYYRADQAALDAFQSAEAVEEHRLSDRAVAYLPEQPTAGLIFYPGGKVEHTAYVPLMEACARQGILCVLVEMPFRLAVLDLEAAQGLQAHFPEVERWYMAGHSLGGAMAGAYLEDHAGDFDGLVLLAAYSTTDLTQSGLRVLSVYGSEDGVMDRETYESSKQNLPDDTVEVVIDGGCHAGFGVYGPQKGDGTPTLTVEEQIGLTARAVVDFVA